MNPVQPQTNMDIGAVNLAKAIRQTESGGNFNAKGASGESGAYQWTAPTWSSHAQQILGDPKAPMTPSNQNAVAYGIIKQWKDQGLNVAQIAAKWNSGSSTDWENKVGTNSYGVQYNVPAYVKKVTDAYQGFKSQNPFGAQTANADTAVQPQTQPTQQPSSGGPAFPASPTDNGFVAGLKAVGNLPGSAYNFGKGVIQSLNPFQTAGNVGNIGSQFGDLSNTEGTGNAILDIIKGLPQATLDTLVPSGVREAVSGVAGSLTNDTIGKSSDLTNAAQTFTNDPFGQAAPLVLAAEGGAKFADRFAGGNAAAADAIVQKGGTFNVAPNGDVVNPGRYSGAFDKTVSTVAKPVLDTVGKVAALPVAVGRSVVSHLTGLNPETISAIVSDPGSFTKLQREAATRPSVAASFKGALDSLFKTNSDTGAEYQPYRDITTPVSVPENFITDTLNKYGIKITDGKIVADTNSITRNPTDIRGLQNFYDNWGGKTQLTPNEFLNMRSDLSKLSKFESPIGKSAPLETVSRTLRQEANNTIRPQIPGLKELDARTSPLIEQVKQARKDFLNGDGTFKDGAANKIANSLGAGKENLLGRMEAVSPGIGKSVRVLKAVEDIQRANGIKTGTYTRGIIEGGAALTGNFGVVIASILTHPEVAVQILKGFGYAGKAVIPILNYLHILTGDIQTKDIPAVGKKLGLTPDEIKSAIENRGGDQVNKTASANNITAPTTNTSSRIIEDSLAQFKKPDIGKGGQGGFVKIGGKDIKTFSDFHPEDQRLLSNFADQVKQGYKPSLQEARIVRETFDQYGFRVPSSIQRLADVIATARDTAEQATLEKGINAKLRPTTVSKVASELSPLAKEAQKYKTAEEFVKAQGSPMYRGTKLPQAGELANADTYGLAYGKGTYLAKERSFAEQYGKNISELYPVLKKPLIMSAEAPKELIAQVKKDFPNWSPKFGTTGEDIHSYIGSNADEANDYLQKLGYDGLLNAASEGSKQTIVFDPANIKTKSQLIDFYNKVKKKS